MDWTELLIKVLYAVIIAVVPIITPYVVKYLKALFDKVDSETSQTVIHSTIQEVQDLIISAVSYTSQTFVDSLKKSGTFDEDAQRKAFEDTKNAVLLMITSETKEILETVYQDVDKWIDLQIESTVRMIKS